MLVDQASIMLRTCRYRERKRETGLPGNPPYRYSCEQQERRGAEAVSERQEN